MTIDEFNKMDADEAEESLLACCGSTKWAKAVLAGRPFKDLDALRKAGAKEWKKLSREDWLEAFAAHPRIGNLNSLKERFAHTRSWASEEQAGASSASETVLSLLAQGNKKYEKRFGHIFIVSAEGKTAAQMLRALKDRLKNEPDAELQVTADEQQKITDLRLQKMIDLEGADA